MENISYMLAPITNKTPSYAVSSDEIYKAVTDPEIYEDITKKYRQFLKDGDLEQARQRKASDFDYVTFSGKFKYVANNGLIKHSGLICIDIDHVDEKIDLKELTSKLINDQKIDTHMLFISPSGDGLKWVIAIEVDEEQITQSHLDYFKAISAYMKTAYSITIDPVCKDLARACFLPYDKDAYFNKNSNSLTKEFVEMWKPADEAPKFIKQRRIGAEQGSSGELTSWEDYNQRGDLGALLQKHGWTYIGTNTKGDMYLRPGGNASTNKYSAIHFKDSNLLYVHSSSSNLPVGENSPAKVFSILEAGYDWSETNKLLKIQGFGKQDPKKLNIKPTELPETTKHSKISADTHVFWVIDKKDNYKIHVHDYIVFIQEALNFAQVRSFGILKLVKIKGKILYESTRDDVIQDTLKYIDTLDPEIAKNVHGAMVAHLASLKHGILTTYIREVKSEMLKETPENAYFYFKDSLLEITKDDIVEKNYTDLDFYIWSYQILDRPWMGKVPYEKSNYYDFLSKVTGEKAERFESLRTIMGFLLHSYKAAANARAVMFIDEFCMSRTNNMAANGGTGKSVVAKSLGFIKKMTRIDGKSLNLKSAFAFSLVSHGDKLILIDDIKRDFDFESLFVKITEDLQIEKKFQDPVSIPFNESPKIIISGNKALKTDGGESDTRRLIFLEFAPFFHLKNKPDEFYNEVFGDEFSWDIEHWQQFDSMMISFVQEYLSKGVKEVTVSYKERELIEGIGPELYEFFNDTIEQGVEFTLEGLLNGNVLKSGIITKGFSNIYDDYSISKKAFLMRLRKWAIYKNYSLEQIRSKNKRKYIIR